MSTFILGIDVAKLKLDVALVSGGKTLVRQFDNSTSGFNLLTAWLTSSDIREVHACLEATGTYGAAVALLLHENGHCVSVVNPYRIKGYAASQMQRNKTDRAYARLIADFCRTQQPARRFPLEVPTAELQAITRRIEVVRQMLQMEQNRLAVAPVKTKASVQRIIKVFEQEIAALQKSIEDHFDHYPALKEQSRLLQTIPGSGEKTADLLLAEIEFGRYQSAGEVAAYAGVTPKRKESGTSLHRTNLSKMGNKRVRKGLYFPAIVAAKHNRIVKEFAARLEGSGKTSMQVVCASVRKLLHIAFGVLKHKTPFDASLVFSS